MKQRIILFDSSVPEYEHLRAQLEYALNSFDGASGQRLITRLVSTPVEKFWTYLQLCGLGLGIPQCSLRDAHAERGIELPWDGDPIFCSSVDQDPMFRGWCFSTGWRQTDFGPATEYPKPKYIRTAALSRYGSWKFEHIFFDCGDPRMRSQGWKNRAEFVEPDPAFRNRVHHLPAEIVLLIQAWLIKLTLGPHRVPLIKESLWPHVLRALDRKTYWHHQDTWISDNLWVVPSGDCWNTNRFTDHYEELDVFGLDDRYLNGSGVYTGICQQIMHLEISLSASDVCPSCMEHFDRFFDFARYKPVADSSVGMETPFYCDLIEILAMYKEESRKAEDELFAIWSSRLHSLSKLSLEYLLLDMRHSYSVTDEEYLGLKFARKYSTRGGLNYWFESEHRPKWVEILAPTKKIAREL